MRMIDNKNNFFDLALESYMQAIQKCFEQNIRWLLDFTFIIKCPRPIYCMCYHLLSK